MHSVEEMHNILAVGIEFPELGMMKIEADHKIRGFDNLFARLEKRSRVIGMFPWDIEEIGAAVYIRVPSVDPAMVTALVQKQLPVWQ